MHFEGRKWLDVNKLVLKKHFDHLTIAELCLWLSDGSLPNIQ